MPENNDDIHSIQTRRLSSEVREVKQRLTDHSVEHRVLRNKFSKKVHGFAKYLKLLEQENPKLFEELYHSFLHVLLGQEYFQIFEDLNLVDDLLKGFRLEDVNWDYPFSSVAHYDSLDDKIYFGQKYRHPFSELVLKIGLQGRIPYWLNMYIHERLHKLFFQRLKAHLGRATKISTMLKIGAYSYLRLKNLVAKAFFKKGVRNILEVTEAISYGANFLHGTYQSNTITELAEEIVNSQHYRHIDNVDRFEGLIKLYLKLRALGIHEVEIIDSFLSEYDISRNSDNVMDTLLKNRMAELGLEMIDVELLVELLLESNIVNQLSMQKAVLAFVDSACDKIES